MLILVKEHDIGTMNNPRMKIFKGILYYAGLVIAVAGIVLGAATPITGGGAGAVAITVGGLALILASR